MIERSKGPEAISSYAPARAITPIITPAIIEDGNIVVDIESILSSPEGNLNLVQFQALNGVDGLFVLGTTGEGSAMDIPQKKGAIKAFIEARNNLVDLGSRRLPILVNVSGRTIDEVMELADYSEELGADSLVLSPLVGGDDPYEKVSNLVDYKKLPIVLYNYPKIQDGETLDDTFIDWVVGQSRIVGVKDSSGNQEIFDRWLRAKIKRQDIYGGHLSVLQGSTRLLEYSLANQSDGYVLQTMNVFPSEHKWDALMPQGVIDTAAVDKAFMLREQFKGVSDLKECLRQQGIIRSSVTF